MNTYTKYCPNVFVAKCSEQHEKGSTITITTKYGKEHECIVFNLLGKDREGRFLYSIVRADGYNVQERAKARAERLKSWADSATNKSNKYWEASHEGRDFLALGEPIKIGHHSEKRHRALIERNHQRIGKAIEMNEKAKVHESKAEYWEEKASTINLSMPESLEYFEYKLEEAKKVHQFLKDNPSKRPHSLALTYANKEVKEIEKNISLAIKLWGDEEDIRQLNTEKEEEAKAKTNKSTRVSNFLQDTGHFFFFGNDINAFKEKYSKLVSDGHIQDGEKVLHVGMGLHIPSKAKDEYLKTIKK